MIRKTLKHTVYRINRKTSDHSASPSRSENVKSIRLHRAVLTDQSERSTFNVKFRSTLVAEFALILHSVFGAECTNVLDISGNISGYITGIDIIPFVCYYMEFWPQYELHFILICGILTDEKL